MRSAGLFGSLVLALSTSGCTLALGAIGALTGDPGGGIAAGAAVDAQMIEGMVESSGGARASVEPSHGPGSYACRDGAGASVLRAYADSEADAVSVCGDTLEGRGRDRGCWCRWTGAPEPEAPAPTLVRAEQMRRAPLEPMPTIPAPDPSGDPVSVRLGNPRLTTPPPVVERFSAVVPFALRRAPRLAFVCRATDGEPTAIVDAPSRVWARTACVVKLGESAACDCAEPPLAPAVAEPSNQSPAPHPRSS
ncbi:MAG: hypothetical protein AB7S26_03275 [Sandaracinaceae bacterium]